MRSDDKPGPITAYIARRAQILLQDTGGQAATLDVEISSLLRVPTRIPGTLWRSTLPTGFNGLAYSDTLACHVVRSQHYSSQTYFRQTSQTTVGAASLHYMAVASPMQQHLCQGPTRASNGSLEVRGNAQEGVMDSRWRGGSPGRAGSDAEIPF